MLFSASVCLGGVLAVAHPLDNWQRRIPPPTLESLNAIGFGGGQFVAVGSSGEVLTSRDGTNWARRDSGVTENLVGITFGNDLFVAIGRAPALSSSDGQTWKTNLVSGSFDPMYGLNSIVFLNGVFVAEAGGCFPKHCQGALIGSRDVEFAVLAAEEAEVR